MARIIPGDQKFLTIDASVKTVEMGTSQKTSAQEYYTINDFIHTAIGPGVTGNAGNLSAAITVTNPDGAYTHLSGVYEDSIVPIGTSVESLLREILNPYIFETVGLTSLSVASRHGVTGVWSGYNNVSSLNLEAGQSFKVQGVTKTVSNPANILDASLELLNGGGGQLVGGISDDTGFSLFSEPLVTVNTIAVGANGEAHLFRLKAVDTGHPSGTNADIFSGFRSITFHNRVRAGGSSESNVTAANASALLSGLNTYNELRGKANIPFEGDSVTDNEANYLWIAYPSFWGVADDIELGSFGVLDDFQSPVTAAVTNDHGHSAYYNFYRSTGKGAFGVGQNVTLKFS